jgi:putative phosphoribosyl transferase
VRQGYRDRADAGRQLAAEVGGLELTDPVVLALPRGGVPVGVEVARVLAAPLDVLLVRKVGAPDQPEFGVGAVGEGGVLWLDDERIDRLGLDRRRIDATVVDEQRRLEEYARTYHDTRRAVDVTGRDVVLVDDGIATGSSALAGVAVVRGRGAARVIVAVPVAAAGGVEALEQVADVVVCPWTVHGGFAVGSFYEDFHQLDHDQVLALLRDADGGGPPSG